MDKNVNFLDSIPPESLNLTLTNEPFFQNQHRDYWNIENMMVTEYDFIICIAGCAEFYINDETILLTEGSALLVPPNRPFSAEHKGDDYFVAVAQHFELKVFGDLDFFKLIKYSNYLSFSNWDYIKTVLVRYKDLSSSQTRKFEQHALFNIILSQFIYAAFRFSQIDRSRDYAFIFQMLDHIQNHFIKEDVLQTALQFSPYSRDYTSKKFRKVIGYSPKQYIIKTRLNFARNLLLQDITIKEAAYQCGFNDELYFSRIFKKYIHMSPKEYRKQHFILVT